AYTLKDTDLDIHFLSNDIVNGIAGNRFQLENVEFISAPALGSFSYNSLSGVFTYSPGLGNCGVDSIVYRITDLQGQQSIATIRITIVCEKVFVFNGISPNGDGKNDTWHILGIEQYPGNEVRVFNRWGNQVFESIGYTNQDAWDGTWNGKDLPDGTYFYVVNLGGGNGTQKGYLQLLR
ncbi:MAG: gliding motility-associated C-terminal domain-containing protein, partial [Saprospiraceae bacterium]|nr:gliding motility-associated C-terminal domain-containing protein [Saprospiraceae bacterium]